MRERERKEERKQAVGVPTWHGDPGGTADDGAQVVDGGHTLIHALVWLVLSRVLHGTDEQRAVGKEPPALVCRQVEERAVFLPLHPHRILAHHRAAQHGGQTPHS